MALSKNPKYDLKRTYNRVLKISFIISLALLILAFKFFPDFEVSTLIPEPPPDIIIVVDENPPTPGEEPPPPPKPVIPIEAPTDELLKDVEIEPIWDINENAGEPSPPRIEESLESEIFEFFAIEDKPEPIGGIGGIQKQIIYPELAIRAGIYGKVFVKAFVDEEGNVFKVELQKGIGGGCDEVAMTAVKNTKFIPGKQRGRAVKVQMTVPINFKLQ